MKEDNQNSRDGLEYASSMKFYKYEPAIYKLTNTVNDRVYIGSALRPTKRFVEHKNTEKRDGHSVNSSLTYDIRKYGIDKFKFEILEYVDDKDFDNKTTAFLVKRENYWIKKYLKENYDLYNKSYADIKYLMTAEQRKVLSESHKGLRYSNETKRNKGEPVIAININTNEAIMADSGKLLGDYFVMIGRNNGQKASKDIIKNKLRKHMLLFGEWYVYYTNQDKLKEMINICESMEKSNLPSIQLYLKHAKALLDKSIDEIKELYDAKYVDYDDINKDVLEKRDGCFVIHSSRSHDYSYNPAAENRRKMKNK